MELTKDKLQILFVSNEIFLEDGFFVLLETLDHKVRNFEIDELDFRVFVDKSVYQIIDAHSHQNNRREQKRIQGIISILKGLSLYEEVDTSNFLDFKELYNRVKTEYKEFEFTFITNTKSTAQKLFLLDELEEFNYEKFDKLDSISWRLEKPKKIVEKEIKVKVHTKKKMPSIPKQLTEAFHTDEVSKYIDVKDQDDINYVYSEKFGYLHLQKDKILEGGEGKIYKSYDNLMVKIYTKEERRYELVKKIQKMIDLHLRNANIVWPKDIVYNKNEFVGYVMDEIDDAEGLDMSRIYSFRDLPYIDRFKICIDLLEMIKYLHNKGILIGDLKFDNIMYKKDTKELYIIDSASFQVDDYSCGVFNADYTHDNLKGKNLREVLRTLEEEYFPINKILFEILMGKGPFYDFKSGEVGSDVERVFHYPLEVKEEITNQQNPLFFWSHADARIRHAFNDYFTNNIITEAQGWIDLLNDILEEAK